jgi:hypothetical protein
MVGGGKRTCWYWPLFLLWVVQRPIATNMLKTFVSAIP